MSSRFLLLFMLVISACESRKAGDTNSSPTMKYDPHSCARPDEIAVKHIHLDLKVDFSQRIISGSARLELLRNKEADTLWLDTRELLIEKVVLDDGTRAGYRQLPEQPFLGAALGVAVKPGTQTVTIEYSTQPSAPALQWLEPRQTAGGAQPFLFTQSQAILARSWIPLQDSPGIRFTYSARITVPPGLMAVMSAANDTLLHADGIYDFDMPQAIPSYLMALSVGDFRFHGYDGRSGVFAEPVTLEAAAGEFVDLPAMISAAEELYGPYAWGRYDVLVLPPSFPFGGMENPRVTFATPTILAGDRSLVSLIAHELAHSWSGNLVTNATWNDFWLNEGFTVYFENRIMEKIYGREYADILTVLSMGELKNTIHELGEKNPDTHLYLNLEGRDPDDGVTDIAYEKGRFFLLMIEREVGRPAWDVFLKKYFKDHAFSTMTTEKFLDYLQQNLFNGQADWKQKLLVKDWIYGPGLPSNCPQVQVDRLDEIKEIAAGASNGIWPNPDQLSDWKTQHWLFYLRSLPDTLDLEKLAELDRLFNFTKTENAEIACDWFQVCIRNHYVAAYPALENFLIKVGRRKFVKPLYTQLASSTEGKELAKRIYAKARPGYHAVTYQTIDELLQ